MLPILNLWQFVCIQLRKQTHLKQKKISYARCWTNYVALRHRSKDEGREKYRYYVTV